MFARLACTVLGFTLLAALPAHADGWDRHRHHGHGDHWYKHKHHHHDAARVVIWQPAPVYRAYPAPYPVYVPVAPQIAQAPMQAVPLRDFQDTSGRYCREYQRTVVIGGQQQQVYGTACMMPDGAWQIVSE